MCPVPLAILQGWSLMKTEGILRSHRSGSHDRTRLLEFQLSPRFQLRKQHVVIGKSTFLVANFIEDPLKNMEYIVTKTCLCWITIPVYIFISAQVTRSAFNSQNKRCLHAEHGQRSSGSAYTRPPDKVSARSATQLAFNLVGILAVALLL